MARVYQRKPLNISYRGYLKAPYGSIFVKIVNASTTIILKLAKKMPLSKAILIQAKKHPVNTRQYYADLFLWTSLRRINFDR